MAKRISGNLATEPISQFVKCFEKVSYSHDAFKVYSDFLTMSAISISNAVNYNDAREQEYLRIIKTYEKKEQEMFPQMFACIVRALDAFTKGTPCYSDILGALFGELELFSSWKGQFFTPQAVSDMMAIVTIGDNEEQISKRGYISLNEPCIGGGANVIGVVNAMFQKGYNPCKQLLVTAYDLDPRCVHMSYIQLSLMGIPAMIQQRNTLSGQTYGDYWFTPVFVLDDWASRLRLERTVAIMRSFIAGIEKEKAVAEIETSSVVKPAPKIEQLTLF